MRRGVWAVLLLSCFASSPLKTCKPDTWTLQALIHVPITAAHACAIPYWFDIAPMTLEDLFVPKYSTTHPPPPPPPPPLVLVMAYRYHPGLYVLLMCHLKSALVHAWEMHKSGLTILFRYLWSLLAELLGQREWEGKWKEYYDVAECTSKPEHPCCAERKKDKAAILSHG